MDMSWLERVPKSLAMVQVMRKSTVFYHRKYLDIPLIHGKSVVFVQTWVQINRPGGILQFVHLSLLTMINPNQLCEVLLFVCSKMADQTNLSSKLPVADRTREVWERKLCWWSLSSGFLLHTFLLGFAYSFCFVFTSTPSYEASLNKREILPHTRRDLSVSNYLNF